MTLDRVAAYRIEIQQSFDHHKDGRAQYMLANLALEELQIKTGLGEEPSDSAIDEAAYRLENAAFINESSSPLLSLRARLLRAYMQPIIWSGILSMDGLSDRQARHAALYIELETAHDDAAMIASNALHAYDELVQTPVPLRTEKESDKVGQVVGFLNEVTPSLLGGRHNTAKRFALPSLAFDDQVSQDKTGHIDGFVYDNRQANIPLRRSPYQVKSNMDSIANPTIPTIYMRDLGNLSKSSSWPPGYDKPFMTVRMLLLERRNRLKKQDLSSRLDRISSTIFNKVTRH
ncbi:MAG: hypothetical protein JWO61_152 [Candidatus Saccharibacteria bacterium]|nr:hypothetical protein [Candidatus Saccharibacteria bacterium]